MPQIQDEDIRRPVELATLFSKSLEMLQDFLSQVKHIKIPVSVQQAVGPLTKLVKKRGKIEFK
jgi:hypothetical protein